MKKFFENKRARITQIQEFIYHLERNLLAEQNLVILGCMVAAIPFGIRLLVLLLNGSPKIEISHIYIWDKFLEIVLIGLILFVIFSIGWLVFYANVKDWLEWRPEVYGIFLFTIVGISSSITYVYLEDLGSNFAYNALAFCGMFGILLEMEDYRWLRLEYLFCCLLVAISILLSPATPFYPLFLSGLNAFAWTLLLSLVYWHDHVNL